MNIQTTVEYTPSMIQTYSYHSNQLSITNLDPLLSTMITLVLTPSISIHTLIINAHHLWTSESDSVIALHLSEDDSNILLRAICFYKNDNSYTSYKLCLAC